MRRQTLYMILAVGAAYWFFTRSATWASMRAKARGWTPPTTAADSVGARMNRRSYQTDPFS